MNVLITGGSSGIGAGLARECARRGDRLFLSGRNTDRLDAVAAECRELGAEDVETQVIDSVDVEAMRLWIRAVDSVSPLDRVFANAGVSTGEETEENVRKTFAINVGGTINTVLPAIEVMKGRRTGQIIITASIAGYGPLGGCPSYSATKSCLKIWGLSLRSHLRRTGVKVSVVCPGFVRSRITDRNTCPMPFFMESDKAARIILARVDRNVGLISFPWPMRFASWIVSVLPNRLNEFINRFIPDKVSIVTTR